MKIMFQNTDISEITRKLSNGASQDVRAGT